MPKQVILDQMTVVSNVINLRFRKEILDAFGAIEGYQYHRSSIEPGIQAANQIASINIYLAAKGWPSVRPVDSDKISALVSRTHSAEIIANFLANRSQAS